MIGVYFILVGIGVILHSSERGYCCEEIYIEDSNDEVVNGTFYITRGGLLVLGCDGSCHGVGYPPNLKWYTPSGEKVSSFPGRIMSIHQQSRRRRKLYVQRFRWRDQGTYSCEGLIHGHFRKKSVKVLIRDCLKITAENAAGLLYSSRKYDVESLFEKSASFLEESLTEENLCGILETSHGYGETDLEEIALKMLQQASIKVTKSPAFLDLCSSCFGNFIKSENLQLEEKEVFEATLSWTKSECERQAVGQSHKNMRKVLGELVYEIRFACLSLEFLTKVVGPSGILNDGERIRIMDRISDSRVDIGPFKSSRRILTVSKSQDFNYLKRFAGVQTTTNPYVTYHAITFSTNKTVSLLGCQLYGSESIKTKVEIEVCSAGNVWMSHPVKQQLALSNIVNDVMFPSPVSIQAGCLYTIYVWFSPREKVEGCGGKEKISESDVVFAFSKTRDSRTFSSVEMGQIPGLIWKH